MRGRLPFLLAGLLYGAPALGQPLAPGAPEPLPEARTDEQAPAVAPVPRAPRWALGAALSWAQRRDYGNVDRANFVPELTAQRYVPVTDELFLRPGVRLGYLGLVQAEMPQDLQVLERDLLLRTELAALYDGPVVPMVALGVGLVVRSVRLATGGVVRADADPISRVDVFPEFSAKLGLGVPLIGSALVLEPHLGYRYLPGDDREGLFYGVDATYALP